MNEVNYDGQEGMEHWIKTTLGPNSRLYQGGVVPMLKPKFERCDYEKKSVTVSYEVVEWELNPEGDMHGGLIVTAIDTAFGILSHYFARQKMVTTVTISTTFLKRIALHDKFEVTVTATSIGRTLISLIAEARICNRDHLLAATGNTTFMILNHEFNAVLP